MSTTSSRHVIALLSVTTAGESHGPALTAIIAGLPTGLTIDREAIDAMLARRQAGHGRSERQRRESDVVRITSGIRHGVTLGTPLAVHVDNRDHENWSAAMSPWPTGTSEGNWRDRPVTVPRPGHVDFAGVARTATMDARTALERASARETAVRVACGSIAQQLLMQLGISVRAHVRAIGDVSIPATIRGEDLTDVEWAQRDASALACVDAAAERDMIDAIDAARTAGDTLGGLIEVVAYGVPPGIGGYATPHDRLDARLAFHTMSVPAIKAVEIGDGVEAGRLPGSLVHDTLHVTDDDALAHGFGVTRESNRAGGIEGGTSNGAPIVVRAWMKPLATLMKPLVSVDLASGEAASAHTERSDVCAVPAASVVVEAETAIALAAAIRSDFGLPTLEAMVSAWHAHATRVGYKLQSGAEHQLV